METSSNCNHVLLSDETAIYFKAFYKSLPVVGSVFDYPFLTNNYLVLISQIKSVSKKFSNKSKKQKFKKKVVKATTFTLMSANLEEMIQWCRDGTRMKKTKRHLTFLRLKCQKMKCLEAAGYK